MPSIARVSKFVSSCPMVAAARRTPPLVSLGLIAALATAVLATTGLTGCGGIPEVTAFREQAAEAREQAAIELDRLEAAAASIPEGDPSAADAGAAVTQAQARRDALDDMVERLDTLLSEADTPTDTLSGVAHQLSPLLPEPFRLPILLAAGLGVSVFRGAQLKRSAASIAAGFQEMMQRDDGLRDGVKRHRDLLNAVQTPTAKRIVDEVTKTDRTMLRLPI
ncbi:MAG: hypothetical protein AAF235_08190 [Planctomycetota bacterium]